MKRIILFITTIFILPLNNFAQKVENIEFHQQDDKVIINYDLLGKKRACYDVKVFYTTDNGKTFNILKSTSKDIGKCIKPEKDKKIVWNVLDDKKGLVGDVQFKIVAEKQEVEYYLLLTYNLDGDYNGGLSINYGWFSSSSKNLGWLFSFSLESEFDYGISTPNFDDDYIGMNFGIMNKLLDNRNFKILSYEQMGLYYKRSEVHFYHHHNNNPYSTGYHEYINYYDGLSFPFPISAGFIFNIYDFNAIVGLKLYNQNINRIKELEEYDSNWDLPPSIAGLISFGLGYTF
ncbi:MAG: hypothetical protein ACOCQ4_02460 [bacterium]